MHDFGKLPRPSAPQNVAGDQNAEEGDGVRKLFSTFMESIAASNKRMFNALTQIEFLAGESWLDADRRVDRIRELARAGLERKPQTQDGDSVEDPPKPRSARKS